MDALEQETLRRKHIYLLDNLDMRPLLPYLYQSRIIDADQEELIDVQQTTRRKVETFLKIFRDCKLPNCFPKFLEVLQKAEWGFVADDLRAEYLRVKSDPDVQKELGDWLETRLTSSGRQRILSGPEIAMISRQVGHGWQQLGAIMGFPPGRLQQLQMQYPYDISQAILHMLNEWSRRHPRATIETFVQVCRKAGIDEQSYKDVILEYSDQMPGQTSHSIL